MTRNHQNQSDFLVRIFLINILIYRYSRYEELCKISEGDKTIKQNVKIPETGPTKRLPLPPTKKVILIHLDD